MKTVQQGEPPKPARQQDLLDQVAQDMQVEEARKACVSDDAYEQEHKHDRELYERAFPQPAKAP